MTIAPATWFDRSDRVRLDVTGPDRAKFLHNLTTNEVKRLAAGRGCEAFVTSPQGKTLGFVQLLAREDRILLRTDPGGLEHVLPHFQKYGLFDDVAWDDASGSTFEFHVNGAAAGDLIGRLGADLPPEGDLDHRATTVAGAGVLVVRESPAGRPGLTLIGPRDAAAAVADALREAGADGRDAATFEALRIAAGTPVFGRDITPENLPQEVGRDARAISFVKGCYLGQETVARIDALGHVNKLLRGLRFAPDVLPPAGAALEAGGKAVGVVTSAARAGDGRAIGLGFVRLQAGGAGAELTVADSAPPATARVVELPMADEAMADGR
jgi:tRNA-modifying protein YgfZ